MTDLEHTCAFVAHLRAEHHRLHEAVRQIEDQWSAVWEGGSASAELPRVIDGLKELRENLARHFAQEEQGGCLEEAVCRCPSLSQEASRIEHEHPFLLEQLDQLIGRTRSGLRVGNSARKDKRDFRELVRQLQAHEAAENNILTRAFGADAEELESA